MPSIIKLQQCAGTLDLEGSIDYVWEAGTNMEGDRIYSDATFGDDVFNSGCIHGFMKWHVLVL